MGHVKNSVTRIGIKDAFITLMREDSAVTDTMHIFKQWIQGKDGYADENALNIQGYYANDDDGWAIYQRGEAESNF